MTRRGERLAAGFAGFLGAGMFLPPEGGDEYQVVFRFADEACLACWADSAERRDWLREGAELVHDSRVRCASGLDAWFGPAPSAPPRWKQAVAIWLAFFPVSLAFTLLLGERLAALPVFWRVLSSTAILTPGDGLRLHPVRDTAVAALAAAGRAAGAARRERLRAVKKNGRPRPPE
ncbi:hypothetical protein [Crenobacter cavernae]|uniref:hypothetical protein n=1 Tax=Crenobacter cavernae TaxID=2290923 RepID=UPI001C6A6A79|nr:hypothetical protein [Crenobacter cavernae]